MNSKNFSGEIITWDFRSQIQIDELNSALKSLGFKGKIVEIDTGDDQHGVVVVNDPEIEDKEVQCYYDETMEGFGI